MDANARKRILDVPVAFFAFISRTRIAPADKRPEGASERAL
jgi:hypothetical protein